MTRFLVRSALGLVILGLVSEAQAGRTRVIYSYPYAPAYGYSYAPGYATSPYFAAPAFHPGYAAYSPGYMPSAAAPAAPSVAGIGASQVVASGHTLVRRTPLNGAPAYYDVYQPSVGFTGVLQFINNAWQFFQSSGLAGYFGLNAGQGGSNGNDSQILSQVKTQIDNFVKQYTQDISAIRSDIANLKNPGGAAAGGSQSPPGNQDPLDQITARLKALNLDSGPSGTATGTGAALGTDNTPPPPAN